MIVLRYIFSRWQFKIERKWISNSNELRFQADFLSSSLLTLSSSLTLSAARTSSSSTSSRDSLNQEIWIEVDKFSFSNDPSSIPAKRRWCHARLFDADSVAAAAPAREWQRLLDDNEGRSEARLWGSRSTFNSVAIKKDGVSRGLYYKALRIRILKTSKKSIKYHP